MFQLIESICYENGGLKNLAYHQARVDRTYQALFPELLPLQLNGCIPLSDLRGKHKCRFVYNAHTYSYTFENYQPKVIKTMKMVEVSILDYAFKYLDRRPLTDLFNQRTNCDDIIIVKDGFITDSYYANLAFYDGRSWLTPRHPLLKGTKRDQLLNDGVLAEYDIRKDNIRSFEKIGLINAMLDLGDVTLDITRIQM